MVRLVPSPWFRPLRQRHLPAQWAAGVLLPGAPSARGCCSGLCQEGQAEEKLQEVDVPLPFVSASSSLPPPLPFDGLGMFVYTSQGQSVEPYPSPGCQVKAPASNGTCSLPLAMTEERNSSQTKRAEIFSLYCCVYSCFLFFVDGLHSHCVWVMCSHSPYPLDFRSLQSPPRPDIVPRDRQQRGFSHGMPYAPRAVPVVGIIYFPLLLLLLSRDEGSYYNFCPNKSFKVTSSFLKITFLLDKKQRGYLFHKGCAEGSSVSQFKHCPRLCSVFLLCCSLFLMTECPLHLREPSPCQSHCPLKATGSQSTLPEQTKCSCDQPFCVSPNPAVPKLVLLLPAGFLRGKSNSDTARLVCKRS